MTERTGLIASAILLLLGGVYLAREAFFDEAESLRRPQKQAIEVRARSSGSRPESGNLPADCWDIAEVVFRDYMRAESSQVYHVQYGATDAILPERFMDRFRGRAPLVRNVLDGIVVDQKSLIDKISREEAIRLDIREIRVQSDTAEADLVYSASHTTHAVKFILVRDGPQWKVKERKMAWIACG